MKSLNQYHDAAKRNEGVSTPTAGRSAPQDIAGARDKPGSRTKPPGHPGSGNGHRVGAAQPSLIGLKGTARAAGRSQRQTAATATAEVPEQPRYDTGLRYDTGVRYAVTDPTLPPAGDAKVKLELRTRTDPALAAFGESHVAAMTGNLLFPTPVPTAELFGTSLAEFEAVLAELENLRLQTKNLTFQKDQIRKNFEFLFAQRGAYVQTASNSNADAIASAGLMIRNAPTPVGALLPPLGLRLELTSFHGELDVRWSTVSGAKGYALECAEVIEGEALLWNQVTVSGKLNHVVKSLTPGKHYAFRVACIGGSNGVSQWSPVVQRMAA
jgi:hypothetical protein